MRRPSIVRTALASGLYGISLATGTTTLLGTCNGTGSVLTVSAVP